MSKSIEFPKDFLWGTATSAHQIEGNNINSDWWRWETTGDNPPKDPSDIACDSYDRYEEDFDLCKDMGNDAVRISVEWARIEPQEGTFDSDEITHYRNVLQTAKNKGLKTFVTLHHFTNPIWFADKGGWLNPKSFIYFSKYAGKCAHVFDDLVDVFTTINEPQVLASQAYLKGIWYPNQKNIFKNLLVQFNLLLSHISAYKAMKEYTHKPVGIVKNIIWFDTNSKSNILDRLVCKVAHFFVSDFFLFPLKRYLDVIGINYYFTFILSGLKINNTDDRVSDLGWWLHSDGLEKNLLSLKKYNLPIYVTENGLADAEDKYRADFIKEHLITCYNAIESGVNLKGYFHWSLLDNFEWYEGFWPRFGLVEIQRENYLTRKPRPSFYYYSDICKNNRVLVD